MENSLVPHPGGAAASHSAPPHLNALIIGTCILAAVATIYILFSAMRRGGGPDRGTRFWVAWVLVLAASTCSVLWALEFLGGDSLSWTVPTLSTTEVGLFALLYAQRNRSAREPTLPSIDADRIGPKEAAGDILVSRNNSINAEVVTVSQDINNITLASLTEVISIVAKGLRSHGQVESAATFLELNVRLPTALADARQLWEAVFAAALEDEKLVSLLSYVRDHLGLRPKHQLENALRDIGITI